MLADHDAIESDDIALQWRGYRVLRWRNGAQFISLDDQKAAPQRRTHKVPESPPLTNEAHAHAFRPSSRGQPVPFGQFADLRFRNIGKGKQRLQKVISLSHNAKAITYPR